MKIITAGLLFCGFCFAQSGPEGALSGVIIDAATREPIEGAQISWRGAPGGKPVSVTSDSHGAYSISLPASQRVGVSISKPGYSTLDLASSDRTNVRLQPGESQKRDFELSKPASLSGRLLSRDSGKPLPGFYIHAIRWYEGLQNDVGFRYPAPPTSAEGAFSIANLPPATYVLVIDPPMAGKIGVPEKAPDPDPAHPDRKEETGYGSVWYPGLPGPEMATPLVLGYAENRRLEIRLEKHVLHRISGNLRAPEDLEIGPIAITLTTAEKGRPTGAEGQIPGTGPFSIGGLEDGSYRILAAGKSKDGKTRAFATRPITIANQSVEGLDMNLQAGVTLKVAVKMAEADSVAPRRFDFLPISADAWGPLDPGAPGAEPSMIRTGLPPGKYNLAVMRIPGYAVASMVVNGVELPAGSPVDLQSSESLVTFVLTTELGTVSGTVHSSDGQPVPDATVLLASESLAEASEQSSTLPPGLEEGVSDAAGRFSFAGLAPGQYKLIALQPGERLRGQDVGSIRNRLRTAKPVTAQARQTTNADVLREN